MKIYRSLTATLLYVPLLLAGCSDTAQFNEASGAKFIDAQTITGAGVPTAVDPSADATAPHSASDPSADSPAGDGATSTVAGAAGGGASGGGTATTGGKATVAGAGTGSAKGSASTPGSAVTLQANVEKLKAACTTGTKKTMKQSVRFAETQKCNWNVDGNLGRLDAHLQAIQGQKASIELPANAQLCELGIGSVATTIQYDDFMILTMNNQVLLSSNKELLLGMTEDQDAAYVWDFTKARGRAVNFDAPSYCLGNGSICNIPVTDTQGSFQFSIDPSVLGKMAANNASSTKLDFALYATGDNDDRDCWHTAFTLDFTLNYVQ
ncbi:MAG: hypothetical protein H7249_06455 [Chitinophagaceae bacterium]|nr:hypothetical protein [Oligoflexus sp.]